MIVISVRRAIMTIAKMLIVLKVCLFISKYNWLFQKRAIADLFVWCNLTLEMTKKQVEVLWWVEFIIKQLGIEVVISTALVLQNGPSGLPSGPFSGLPSGHIKSFIWTWPTMSKLRVMHTLCEGIKTENAG